MVNYACFDLFDGKRKVMIVPRRGGKYGVRCIGYRSPLFVNGRFIAYDWTKISYFVYESRSFKEAFDIFCKEVNYLMMISESNFHSEQLNLEVK